MQHVNEVSSTYQIYCFNVYGVTIYYNLSLKTISLKYIKNRRSFTKIIKLEFSSKDLSCLINISFAYAHTTICIQGWLKCDMSLV